MSQKKKKLKKKMTPAHKAARKKRRAENRKNYQYVFMHGKQVRVERPPTIDGLSVDEFIRQNADPIWLHQNGLWEYMASDDENSGAGSSSSGAED